eukprot:CAMPEP_0195334910 /NCGR_PEP_ID=MMETSP0708-20121125/15165_1 /TAXON_ID=33640 /ORGANISM="Asterionellopsis glacialis, Strain CCMP134" /LENGTH=333 /DNA_ID=CAMNT_0040404971 /DNA_START=57 /DNA_END=1058 /DNA_ORIENTATION=+
MATSPFSFQELLAQDDNNVSPAVQTTDAKVIASDGVELAVHIYEPSTTTTTSKTTTALVFYHGGGAHAGAGYQHLARGLSEDHGMTVYLPDIRGHGSSGGPRGDAPSKEQVWKDVDAVLEFVAHQRAGFCHSNIMLGGHSSGGGLVVNYATEWRKQQQQQEGAPTPVSIGAYILVSPELGYKSETARPGRTDFAKVNIFSFLLNGIFGIQGHSRAVQFQYPKEILDQDEGLVGFNTVHMANAITPENPREQVLAMTTGDGSSTTNAVSVPVGLWVGSEDELFVAESVAAYVTTDKSETNNNNTNASEIIPGKNHLGILVDIHKPIGQWTAQNK